MIIWITGISGSGKTTFGKYFYKIFKKKYNNTIYIDGDEFRKIFFNDLNYTLKDRNQNAARLVSLVKYLSKQKINIVIAANLTSKKYRDFCRKNIKDYYEIFIDTPLKILIKRDYKNLYKNALRKKIINVVGVDIKFIKPKNSHYVIKNIANKKKLYENFPLIIKNLKKNKIKIY